MSDYTIRIAHLPKDIEFGFDQTILAARLWSHIQTEMARTDLEERLQE